MTSSSRTGRFLWHCALAGAVIVGAAGGYGYSARQQVNAAGRQVRVEVREQPASPGGADQARSTTPPPPPPAPKPVLPFNAKLRSEDIPVPGGGVRDGGCSGALIHPQWIITAGHCFHDINDVRVGGQPRYHMTVTVGKIKESDPGGHTVQVVDVRQSPLNDLAVGKLSAPITDIAPLTLPEGKPPVGQRLQFAGWGSTSATVITSSDHLKRGEFTISKINASTLEALPVVPRTVENSPCRDDSGAPFYTSSDDVHGQLVATEVSGPSCPQAGTEILARVDVVAAWIRQQLEDGEP